MARGHAKPKKDHPPPPQLVSESDSSSSSEEEDDSDRDPSFTKPKSAHSSESSSSSDEEQQEIPAKYRLKPTSAKKECDKSKGKPNKPKTKKTAHVDHRSPVAKPKKHKTGTKAPPPELEDSTNSENKKSWWTDQEKVALFTVAHKHRRLMAEHTSKKNAPLKEAVKNKMLGKFLACHSDIFFQRLSTCTTMGHG